MALSLCVRYTNHLNRNEFSLRHLTQVKEEWRTAPFTQVALVDNENCPSSHPYEVVYQMFEGSAHFCDCLALIDQTRTDHKGNEKDNEYVTAHTVMINRNCETDEQGR